MVSIFRILSFQTYIKIMCAFFTSSVWNAHSVHRNLVHFNTLAILDSLFATGNSCCVIQASSDQIERCAIQSACSRYRFSGHVCRRYAWLVRLLKLHRCYNIRCSTDPQTQICIMLVASLPSYPSVLNYRPQAASSVTGLLLHSSLLVARSVQRLR